MANPRPLSSSNSSSSTMHTFFYAAHFLTAAITFPIATIYANAILDTPINPQLPADSISKTSSRAYVPLSSSTNTTTITTTTTTTLTLPFPFTNTQTQSHPRPVPRPPRPHARDVRLRLCRGEARRGLEPTDVEARIRAHDRGGFGCGMAVCRVGLGHVLFGVVWGERDGES